MVSITCDTLILIGNYFLSVNVYIFPKLCVLQLDFHDK